jgi:hypothetical protein
MAQHMLSKARSVLAAVTAMAVDAVVWATLHEQRTFLRLLLLRTLLDGTDPNHAQTADCLKIIHQKNLYLFTSAPFFFF